jgi:hypothetical protein
VGHQEELQVCFFAIAIVAIQASLWCYHGTEMSYNRFCLDCSVMIASHPDEPTDGHYDSAMPAHLTCYAE